MVILQLKDYYASLTWRKINMILN